MNTTDILLSALITLIGSIAVVFWNELKDFRADIKGLLVRDAEQSVTIKDHEKRIGNLEEKVFEV
jgi:hypothetical protein